MANKYVVSVISPGTIQVQQVQPVQIYSRPTYSSEQFAKLAKEVWCGKNKYTTWCSCVVILAVIAFVIYVIIANTN